MVDAVAQGEIAFGATDADDVAAAQALGQPVDFLPLPLDEAAGTLGDDRRSSSGRSADL